MLKTTLFGALAGGLILAAASVSPVAAAPAATGTPQVDTNTSEVQYRRRHQRHYRHHSRQYHRHRHYSPYYHYTPRPSIFRPW